jgi:chemotaxis protein methyltransferase CheR
MGPRDFNMFRELVHQRTGIWLRDGKQVMLASRLSRRLRHHGMTSFADYYAFVQDSGNDSEEIHELINCVTTNKTSFFREKHHFDFLANTVMPQIQSATRFDTPKSIRVWSAACSIGAEPYSIAITLLESSQALSGSKHADNPHPTPTRAGLPGLNLAFGGWRIEVVASDIDTAVLETARRGIYKLEELDSVDPLLHGRYFLLGKDDMQGRMKVKQEVARLIQFKRINLVDKQWPLEGLFDVIFFRNALIYFNRETQDVFLRKMARYLKPGGYLFLGHSEHIPWLGDIFTPLRQTMYQLRGKP